MAGKELTEVVAGDCGEKGEFGLPAHAEVHAGVTGPVEAEVLGPFIRKARDEDLVAARAGVRAMIRLTGADPEAPGMAETPDRVVRAMMEMTQGYAGSAAEILERQFEPDPDLPPYDEMIILRGIHFTSLCEHHLLPFNGRATVAYIPKEGGRVVGLSKLARLVDLFAQRLQIQERLTVQVARALEDHLQASASACVIRATHQCMACRGVRKPGAEMLTSAMYGRFRRSPAARSELLSLID